MKGVCLGVEEEQRTEGRGGRKAGREGGREAED